MMHMYGYWIPHIYWAHFGGQTDLFGWTIGLLVGWACNLIAALWAADVFSRELDARLAKLVVRLQNFCFDKTL